MYTNIILGDKIFLTCYIWKFSHLDNLDLFLLAKRPITAIF